MFDSWKIDSQGAAGFSRNRYLLAVCGTLALAALAAVTAIAVLAPTTAVAQSNGTTLDGPASKTAKADYTRTFEWTIDKSVDPDKWDLFTGDSGTSDYTVKVTKDEGTDAATISGEICVHNGGAVATENLKIVDELRNGVPPPNDLIATTNVDVSSNPVLDPVGSAEHPNGETGCYPYEIELTPGQTHPGGTYKNTANITITNHSGHLGEEFGPSPSATDVMPAEPTLINDEIDVTDTNGESWHFTNDGSQTYSRTFNCDDDEGEHNNTATMTNSNDEELGSDSASVTVNCYAPVVTKDADTSLDRTFDWSIVKSADQTALTLSTGQSFNVNYSVVVSVTDPQGSDSNHKVKGNITVSNPTGNPPADITEVSDTISGFGAATVDCGAVSFPYTIPAGGELKCTYEAALPNANSRTNTATATLQNYDYDSSGSPTADGTTEFTGTASVDFSNANVSEIDECVDVTDTHPEFASEYPGADATVCVGDSPKTFTYSHTVGPYETCGPRTVDNTASFETTDDDNDTGATGSDSWTVNVNVPCGGGCTLTQGYWKTHSLHGPAPYDNNWLGIGPSGADTTFFQSGKTYYQVLWTAPAGNAYYILAQQYIAAKLNVLNGASTTPAVTAAITYAETFFANNTPNSTLSKTVRQAVIAKATTLDAYNNGGVGPGHCSEQNSA